MKTTEEKNRMIAEFMGFKLQDNPNERWFEQFFTTPTKVWSGRIEILHFDTSWDWLMPVVEKINSELKGVMNVLIMSNACRIYADDNSFNHSEEQDSTIQATYQAVVKFIEWYNKQK